MLSCSDCISLPFQAPQSVTAVNWLMDWIVVNDVRGAWARDAILIRLSEIYSPFDKIWLQLNYSWMTKRVGGRGRAIVLPVCVLIKSWQQFWGFHWNSMLPSRTSRLRCQWHREINALTARDQNHSFASFTRFLRGFKKSILPIADDKTKRARKQQRKASERQVETDFMHVRSESVNKARN